MSILTYIGFGINPSIALHATRGGDLSESKFRKLAQKRKRALFIMVGGLLRLKCQAYKIAPNF
jgi:hypothetical protein